MSEPSRVVDQRQEVDQSQEVDQDGALAELRRFTRNMVLGTNATAVFLPLLVLFRGSPINWATILLFAGQVLIVAVHTPRIVRLVMRGPWQLPNRRTSYLLLGLSVGLMCLALSVDVRLGVFWALPIGMVAADFTIGVPLVVGSRIVLPILVGTGMVGWLAVELTGQQDGALRVVVTTLVLIMIMAYGLSLSFRQWELALELETARKQAAELAATRERLRLAEDLHDILGHALEVVSLKSELAARLSTADPGRSHAEMVEVQLLAREALRDVRSLAQGRRPTDLAVELAGARSLLESAGIECGFAAEPERLDTREREVLGRVLREAVTNLLRHADARVCRVTLSVDKANVTLRVTNDGATPLPPDAAGSGLVGLARRVGEAGGTFTAGAGAPGTFEVEATVPRGATK